MTTTRYCPLTPVLLLRYSPCTNNSLWGIGILTQQALLHPLRQPLRPLRRERQARGGRDGGGGALRPRRQALLRQLRRQPLQARRGARGLAGEALLHPVRQPVRELFDERQAGGSGDFGGGCWGVLGVSTSWCILCDERRDGMDQRLHIDVCRVIVE